MRSSEDLIILAMIAEELQFLEAYSDEGAQARKRSLLKKKQEILSKEIA